MVEVSEVQERDWDVDEARSLEDGVLDDVFDDEGSEPPPEALEELEAVATAEAAQLAEARAAIEAERERTRLVLARYREAVLAAEPDLPPELVRGDSLEELDVAVAAARSAVAEIARASPRRARAWSADSRWVHRRVPAPRWPASAPRRRSAVASRTVPARSASREPRAAGRVTGLAGDGGPRWV